MEDKKKYCVLIDSDNVAPKYIKGVFNEMSKYGSTPIRRLYGDLTLDNKKNWKEICLNYSIKQVQSYNHTKGKNATDSSMIIDCMDILYTKEIDGFVIVSSDADFTGLAERVRESNKEVIGMGEKKTSSPFIKACNEFKYLENLISEPVANEIRGDIVESTEKIEKKIHDIVLQNDGQIFLSQLKERILKLKPDFDERTYGYQQFNKMISDMKSLEVSKSTDNTTFIVKIHDSAYGQKQAHKTVLEILLKSPTKSCNLSGLNNTLSNMGIDYHSFGYSRFTKFLKSIPDVIIESNSVSLGNVNLDEQNEEKTNDSKEGKTLSLEDIYQFIINMIKEAPENKVALSLINENLVKKGIKYKELGYSKISKFLEEVSGIEIKNNTAILAK